MQASYFEQQNNSNSKNAQVPAQFYENFGKLEGITVLLIFLLVVIVSIYLIAITLIFFRKVKSIVQSKHSPKIYYSMLIFYIISKLILCLILIIQIITQIPNQWQNLKSSDIQVIVKNSIFLADYSIIELFLVALYFYLKICFISIYQNEPTKIRNTFFYAIKFITISSTLSILIPLVIYDFGFISYEVMNGISVGFNSLMILLFLISFFYLNFKMSGIMIENRLNSAIKKLFKVLCVILISRIMMLGVQITIAVKVHDGSFSSFINLFQEIQGQFVAFGMCFIGTLIIILLTQGLPIMYSLKSSVIQTFMMSLSYKQKLTKLESNIYNNSVKQELLGDNSLATEEKSNGFGELGNLNLSHFTNIQDAKDHDSLLWTLKRGRLSSQEFMIKIAKHEISSYIIEDIQTEIAKWNELKLTHLNQITYFKEKEYACFAEPYFPNNLDSMISKCINNKQKYSLALQVAKGIQQLHQNEIIHGSLKPSCILFDSNSRVQLTSMGFQSLKKYISLITGYTNKSMYTCVQILGDKGSVIIKPKKSSDIYSLGMIFYEMLTGNRLYRQQSLADCKLRFYEQKSRPKIPQEMDKQIKLLIRNCWQIQPQNRPGIGQVVQILRKVTGEL